MLALLALCHPFGFLYFFAILHAWVHVYAWVYVSSILQYHGTTETWSKPTFVLLGHPPLFDNMFVCPHWLSLIVFLLACLPSSCLLVCLLACFLCHCMYMLGAWTCLEHGHLEQRCDPLSTSEKGKDASKKTQAHKRAMFSRLGGLASLSSFLSSSLLAVSLESCMIE